MFNLATKFDMKNESSNNHCTPPDAKHVLADSAFSQNEENELQRLVRKIKYMQPTHADMVKSDELTRKKWKSEGIG